MDYIRRMRDLREDATGRRYIGHIPDNVRPL